MPLLRARLSCHHGSASAEPGGRPRHLPPSQQARTALPRPRSALPAPTCGRGSSGSSASRPPARSAAAAPTMLRPPPARSTSLPLPLSRPAYSPSRGGAQTQRRPNKSKQKKRLRRSSAGALGLSGLEKMRLRDGDLVALYVFLRRGSGEGEVELFSLSDRTCRSGSKLLLKFTLDTGTVSLRRETAFLRWSVPQGCPCLRSIWTTISSICFNLVSAQLLRKLD